MCIECDLAEPESLASLGGSAPGVVDGIWSIILRNKTQTKHPIALIFISVYFSL